MLTAPHNLRNHPILTSPSIFVINVRDIEYFTVVAGHGHVGRAAESLGLSQSGLSMSLRRMEQHVQAKLFKRTPKGVELTTVGSLLLSRMRQLRLAHEDVIREVADLGQGLAGHLRVGASPGIAEDLVASSCTALAREAPKATVKIVCGMLHELLPSLDNGEMEVIFSGISTRREDLYQEKLIDDNFVVYASVRHRLAHRKQVSLTDIAREQWVAPSTFILWRELIRTFEQNGIPPPRIAIETNSASIRRRVASCSDFLGFGSRLFVQSSKRRFKLVELPVKQLSVSRPVGFTYRKNVYLSPIAVRFIEILRANAKQIVRDL